jgi:hypothetical protein
MATYRETISSPRTPEEVFDYMANFCNVAEWDPTAAEANQTAGEAPGEGAPLPRPRALAGARDPARVRDGRL